MAIKIIDDDCRIEDGKLVIVIEGSNPEEVTNHEARALAVQKAARMGYQRIGINGQSGSFPVDAEGNEYEDQNKQAADGLIAAYRNEIILMGGL